MSQRIPDSVVNSIRDKTDIIELLKRYIPDLKKAGRNHSACCPFHDEKTPSFNVNERKQYYTCYGCGANGNAINFLMEYENMSFPAAVRKLGEECGVEVPDREISKEEKEVLEKSDKLQAVASFAAKRFYDCGKYKEAKTYLDKRELDQSAINSFAIGYAPDSFDFITGSTRDQWKELNLELGLIAESVKKPGKFYDFFRNRIIFPIRNIKGKTIGFGGRAIDNDIKPKYINTPESEIFKKSETVYGLFEALRDNERPENIYVVEGYMDVVSMSKESLTNTVATMGTAVTDGHCHLLFKHTDNLTFVFDGDDAGYNAAIKAAQTVAPFLYDGRSARFVLLPPGVDPDSTIKESGIDVFNKILSESICITELLTSHAQKVCGNQDIMANRAKACGLLGSVISEMPTGFMRELFISDLAKTMEIDSGVVRSLVLKENSVETTKAKVALVKVSEKPQEVA